MPRDPAHETQENEADVALARVAAQVVSKSEQRLWNILMAIAIAGGGWWIQNQTSTATHLADETLAAAQRIDEKYASAARVDALTVRFDKLSEKLDHWIERELLEADHKPVE